MRSIHHEMRALSFFRVGHLPRQNVLKLFLGHIRAGQNSLALQFRARCDNNHRVDTLLAAGLEQQGDVDDRDGRAGVFSVYARSASGSAPY